MIVNEQGGIGRQLIEGGVKAVAFETILPTDEPKDETTVKGSGDGSGTAGQQKTSNVQANLFDGDHRK